MIKVVAENFYFWCERVDELIKFQGAQCKNYAFNTKGTTRKSRLWMTAYKTLE